MFTTRLAAPGRERGDVAFRVEERRTGITDTGDPTAVQALVIERLQLQWNDAHRVVARHEQRTVVSRAPRPQVGEPGKRTVHPQQRDVAPGDVPEMIERIGGHDHTHDAPGRAAPIRHRQLTRGNRLAGSRGLHTMPDRHHPGLADGDAHATHATRHGDGLPPAESLRVGRRGLACRQAGQEQSGAGSSSHVPDEQKKNSGKLSGPLPVVTGLELRSGSMTTLSEQMFWALATLAGQSPQQ